MLHSEWSCVSLSFVVSIEWACERERTTVIYNRLSPITNSLVLRDFIFYCCFLFSRAILFEGMHKNSSWSANKNKTKQKISRLQSNVEIGCRTTLKSVGCSSGGTPLVTSNHSHGLCSLPIGHCYNHSATQFTLIH